MNKRIHLLVLAAFALVGTTSVSADAQTDPKAAGVGLYSGEWDSAEHLYPFVLHDEPAADYKMYYTGSARYWMNESIWGHRMIGLSISADGLSWRPGGKPRQPVVYARKCLQGDVLNPRDLSAVFDSAYAFGPCVIREGDTYRMWYTGWAGDVEHVGAGVENKINLRIGYATSADGVEWTKRPGNAGARAMLGLGGPADRDRKGVGQPFVIKEGPLYRMWYEGFDGAVWRIFYATSPDGVQWRKHGDVLSPGASGSLDQMGARNPVVVKRNGVYELWYQGRGVGKPQYHVMRAVSPDGVTWTKLPGEVAVHPDPPLEGREDLHVDSVFVQPDGACRVYFGRQQYNPRQVFGGGTVLNPRYQVYTEVVNP